MGHLLIMIFSALMLREYLTNTHDSMNLNLNVKSICVHRSMIRIWLLFLFGFFFLYQGKDEKVELYALSFYY